MDTNTNFTDKKQYNGTLTEEVIEHALRKTFGNQTKAAEILACHRSTVCKLINASEYLKAVSEECVESRLDTAEDSLRDLIEEKELGAICFYLKTIGKRRGYIESRGDENKVSIEAVQAFEKMFSRIYIRPNDTGTPQPETD